AVKSDRIVLEAVSPPWQAWSCSLFSASMKLTFLGTRSSIAGDQDVVGSDESKALHFGDHTQDYESASKLVKQRGGYMLLIFSGSNWC